MNRLLPAFLAGAFGGAIMAFAIVALARILVLDPLAGNSDRTRTDARIDQLESRIQRLELNSGQLDARDARRTGALQSYP